MIISIDNIIYDTDLVFSGQTQDCQNYVNNKINTIQPTYNFDESNRPFESCYNLNENTEIIKQSIWNTPAPSCGIEQEIIFMKGIEIWHEPDYTIRFVLSLLNNALLLQQYPEFAQKVKDNNLPSYIINNNIYIYDNTVNEQNRSLLEAFGAIITIKNNIASDAFINYGKSISTESLPALKSKEVKYFKLNLVTSLACYDVTNQMKKAGATDFQGLYDKEALIIIYLLPKDLRLKIAGKEIRDTIHEEGRYKVYVKPTNQKLILRLKNYEDAIIEFENDELKSKDVKYFRVETPQNIVDIDESVSNDIKVGDYSISSKPSGALIQMTGRPDFNNSKHTTPYTLEGYRAGSEIITLTLNKYEIIKDTINISSTKGKKSNYNFIPKFALINCNIDPPIPISKILMDENELILIEDGKDFECPKGAHTITINAPHYYSETRQIDLAAGKTSEINIKLKPIMGSLSIMSGINTLGAEVKINDRKIGEIPI